jgi:hypothetical protein
VQAYLTDLFTRLPLPTETTKTLGALTPHGWAAAQKPNSTINGGRLTDTNNHGAWCDDYLGFAHAFGRTAAHPKATICLVITKLRRYSLAFHKCPSNIDESAPDAKNITTGEKTK